MPVYRPDPQFRVTTSYGGSNYTFTNDQFISGRIQRVENGFDTASLWLSNYESVNWLSKMDAGSAITIDFRYGFDSWTEVFDGVIRFVNTPLASAQQGFQLELVCDGKGYGFEETICTHEYGSESNEPALNTMRLILNQAILGIVDGHVNNMFTDHVTDTGYSYTSNATTCEDIAGEIKYLYYPGVPNTKAIQQLFEVVQAIKGANAGPHWIVDVSGNLLVCTVNASHPDAANNLWYKYYGNSQANATLTQGVDFSAYNFQKMAKEANYILYHGACVCPPGGDYAENNSASWDVSHVDLTLSNDNAAGNFKVGSYSVKGSTTRNDGVNLSLFYPKTGFLNLNVGNLSGARSAPTFSFYAKKNSEVLGFDFILWEDWDGAADWAEAQSLEAHMTNDKWTFFSFDLKNRWKENTQASCTESANLAWDDIDRINFYIEQAANANNKYIWVDGVSINGTVLRGARQSAAYSSTDPMKSKTIHDNIAKGDTLTSGTPGTTDTGTIARLAKAELLRTQTTPLIGYVKTPLIIGILPGQLFHIHAEKKRDNTFNVDKDMRVTKLLHEWSDNGFLTTSYLTDDLANSYVRPSFMDPNTLLAATREYATRQAITSKLGEIDITQTVLEESY